MADDFDAVFALETGIAPRKDDLFPAQDTDEDTVFRKVEVFDQHPRGPFSGRDDDFPMFDGYSF